MSYDKDRIEAFEKALFSQDMSKFKVVPDGFTNRDLREWYRDRIGGIPPHYKHRDLVLKHVGLRRPKPVNPFHVPVTKKKFVRKNNSMRAIVEQIPDDGCLLVFNGYHISWKSLANRMGYTVFVCDPFSDTPAAFRDLYIVKSRIDDVPV